jgi:uncharacterized protein (TIGR03435 family)
MKLVALLSGIALAAAQGPTQKPAFEAATIKPAQAALGSTSGIREEKGRFIGNNVTLKRCIRGAYDISETLIFGGPKWVDEERYDIEATAGGPVRGNDLMIMLQSLLSERFHLAFHREQRQMSGYALVIAKGGLKAELAAKDATGRTNASYSGGSIDAQASTMSNLAQKISEALHVPVSDATQTEGRFNFKLSWNPDDGKPLPPNATGRSSTEPSAPSIFTAVQEQLGLKLESRRVPVDVIVIDRAERPDAN